jgi:DNA-binding GntR family transcriptional regulator
MDPGTSKRERPGKPRTQGHIAYEELRKAILSAELAAGDVVNEGEWARRLGMSRTPVREALNRLRQDGLVETVRHRGTFVREASLDDLRDIFELRKVLECLAAEEAVYRLSDADISQVLASWEALLRDLEEGRAPDYETVGRLDNQFHLMIVGASTNRRLRDFMQGLDQEVLRYQLVTARTLGNVEDTVGQHLQLARLLERRDGPALSAALRQHISDAEGVIFSGRG